MESASNSKFLPKSLKRQKPFSFSVVINTDNRLDYLKRTLSGLRYLTYPHFEVCVVAGPTPDGTREYLATLGDSIKLAFCEVRNLSQSRNIGIAMADGDAVVFIDDDSVPEPEWLADLAKSYEDDAVGAVGGFVYDHTGVRFQARYVTVNRLGYAHDSDRPSPHLSFPLSNDFPHLLGTNCSFRLSALKEIGGFDEEYEYFLDETDVCCRIIDAGYKIEQRPDAFVHHKYAPSHLRDKGNIVRNWYPLIKNRVYYGMRNGCAHHSISEIVGAGIADASAWEQSVRTAAKEAIYTESELQRFLVEARDGIEDGYARGCEPPKLLTNELISLHHGPFRRYPTAKNVEDRFVICFVTQDYPPGQNGGIARSISQLARTMAAEGHHVHVLTKSQQFSAVDYEDGVWVHRVAIRHFDAPSPSPVAPHTVPAHIWNYTQTMLEEVDAIDRKRKVDAVYCPLWDCEPLSFVLDDRFPLILFLQTTMKFWLESQPLKLADKDWMATFGHPIIAMEEFILKRAPLMRAISHAIVEDIQKKYKISMPNERIYHSPLCMEDWSTSVKQTRRSKNNNKVRVLFVGRLESRKGIDVLFEAIVRVFERYDNAVLDIVGDDTILKPDGSTYKADFLKLELPRNIRSRIVFHGRVEEDELRQFYKNCDIFVAPSRYESFGLVFLEALMFGKPVIGCNAGGMPEVIKHGETGFLVPPGDADKLSIALEKLLSDPALFHAMGEAARKDYEERFTERAELPDLEASVKRLRGLKVRSVAA